MLIFEPHIHMYSRVTDDYERMALAGVRAVLEPAFWLGQNRTNVGSFVDYFDTLIGWERFRSQQFGIHHFCTVRHVRIQRHDVVTVASCEALTQRAGITRAGLGDDSRTVVACDSSGAVGRIRIDHHHLAGAIALRRHASQFRQQHGQ